MQKKANLDSVNNYCNAKFAINGELTHFDILVVQYIYGAPQ